MTSPIDSLSAALEFIHDTRFRGGKNGLTNMRRLMADLGNPQERLRCVHIAGTNGKGSVCAFIQAILRCAGYRTGLYTSPYLQTFNERIRVDGKPIPDGDLIRLTDRVSKVVGALRGEGIFPTEFEIITAIGFLYFDEVRVDAVVVEVGIGGRLDSTNIITPMVTAITSIDLDHTKMLGATVERIAFEKAGIAKPGVPMILYPGADEAIVNVVRGRCATVGAPFVQLKQERIPAGFCRYWPASRCQRQHEPDEGVIIKRENGEEIGYCVGLLGAHQGGNSATARAACAALRECGLRIPDSAIDDGLLRAAWPGRLEWVRAKRADFPRVVLLDGAHNPQGARALADYLDALRMPVTLVTGMLREKDAEGFARIITPRVHRILTVAPDSTRAIPAVELARVFNEASRATGGNGGIATPCPTLSAALHLAKSSSTFPMGWCAVAGSLYLVGEARTLLDAAACTLLKPPMDNDDDNE
ncbi:MAG: bifunctional folylpolyglutamate synthase/dihydrofolate synthase [Oscillospiraceae bacterium]|nr:bifunctional folylpolyglutamate synthase/dihydrofolate synthase [Oscillospiraceae bacterium]